MNVARRLASPDVAPVFHAASAVLIATPNSDLRRTLAEKLRRVTRAEEACTGAEALERLQRMGARVVLLDRNFPDLNSDELIAVIERQYPGTDVVPLDSTTGALQLSSDQRQDPVLDWLCGLSPETPEPAAPTSGAPLSALLPGVVGASPALANVAAMVRAVARHSTAVLITGETGVGKELIAEAVHRLSPRAERPFVTVNCAAIPETLLEAELFGHTRGAFTGAVQSRLGKIHAAQLGTIFFDEIGELPLASQAKLLRFLECGEVQRLGTSDVFRLDVRVVAATNVELERRVEQGLFREDLYYRLSVFPLELPPLRERLEDIPLLANFFLERLAAGSAVRLSAEAEQRLLQHAWPGNIRELRNVMERAYVLAHGEAEIGASHLVMKKPCAKVRRVSESS